MFCSKFVDHISKIRQTKPEKLKKGLKFDIGRLCSEPFILYPVSSIIFFYIIKNDKYCIYLRITEFPLSPHKNARAQLFRSSVNWRRGRQGAGTKGKSREGWVRKVGEERVGSVRVLRGKKGGDKCKMLLFSIAKALK